MWRLRSTNWCGGTTIWRGGLRTCGGTFDAAHSPREVEELEKRISAPDFWNNQAEAQKVLQRQRRLEEDRQLRDSLKRRSEDLGGVVEWANAGEDVTAGFSRALDDLEEEVEAAE